MDYRDQTLLATRVVQTLSREGELRIPALLLPHEYHYLRQHLAVHLLQQDVYVVAQMLDALRVLGGHDDDALFRVAMSFLMATQRPDGSWTPFSSSPLSSASPSISLEKEETYRTTVAALRALVVRDFKGYGPLPLQSVDLLLTWQVDDSDPPSKGEETKKIVKEGDLIDPSDGSVDTRVMEMEDMVKRFVASSTTTPTPSAAAASSSSSTAAAADVVEGPSHMPKLAAVSSTSSYNFSNLGPPPPSPSSSSTIPLRPPSFPLAATTSEPGSLEAKVIRLGEKIEKGKNEKTWTEVSNALQVG